jgi:hypothetical protein
MTESHSSVPTASSLLSVVCVALLHREHPEWLAVGVTEAARAAGLNPERVSRLATRTRELLAGALDSLTRRGRPPRGPKDESQAEFRRARSLLSVATSVLALLPRHTPASHAVIVGAWQRLSKEEPTLTKEEFCEAMSLSPRTFRHWRARAPAPEHAATPPPPKPAPRPRQPRRQRPLRRPRFQFDIGLPGVQFGSDTTDLEAFGVPLKLSGVQDIGGRDARLFDAVVVDTHESSDRIVKEMEAALKHAEGAQMITDQGKPFMAQATRAALDALETEHAPQKEGDPRGKATVERGCRSVKDCAAPLLVLSNTLATLIPWLRSPDIAVPYARVVMGVVLRSYQAGARAARRAILGDERAERDDAERLRVAAKAREVARADDRSARLMLELMHGQYAFKTNVTRFVDLYRRFPLSVLRKADAALRAKFLMGRSEIRSLDPYFAALVRTEYAAFRALRAEHDASAALEARDRRDDEAREATERARREDPQRGLRDALAMIASQWLPAEHQLLFDGEGNGLGLLRRALAFTMSSLGPTATDDVVAGVLDAFGRAEHTRLGNDGIECIHALVQRELAKARNSSALAPNSFGATPISGRSTRSTRANPLLN